MVQEYYRPRFHFTAKENWLNDPNGCVFYEGEYHLFFQHNPQGIEWGNMTWGHAVSPDLVHWRQLPHALLPYGGGTIFSGSAVVDFRNTSGLGNGCSPPMVAAFTHARKPFGQAIAFSTDKGRTWTLYADGLHVVPNQGLDEGERDPKVFWHEPSRKWVMLLWVQFGRVRFFTSDNLIRWTAVSDFLGDTFFECPDLFALPVDGDEANVRWVLHDGALNYWIGTFDGTAFVPEAGPIRGDFGRNFYAAQTWNNTGSRVVQIGWMRGGVYPDMPFNQQMSFPCELSLRTTSRGIRLFRIPCDEIKVLRGSATTIYNRMLGAGETLFVADLGELFDIEIEVELPAQARFSIWLYEQAITFADGYVACLGERMPLVAEDGAVRVRLLVDRTSIELFGNHGESVMSSCFVPQKQRTKVQVQALDAGVCIRSLLVHPLASALT